MGLEQGGVGVHQACRAVDAGVVDQAVQAAHGLGGFDRCVPVFFLGDIVMQVDRAVAELRRQGLAGVVEHVADDDSRPLGDAGSGFGSPLSARAAADEDDFSK